MSIQRRNQPLPTVVGVLNSFTAAVVAEEGPTIDCRLVGFYKQELDMLCYPDVCIPLCP